LSCAARTHSEICGKKKSVDVAVSYGYPDGMNVQLKQPETY